MRRRMGGPKRASNLEQKKLVENGKELKKDPMKVIPECQDSCFLCKFGRAKRKIKKIAKNKDNEEALKKYAKRGPDLAKATAGALLLALSEKAPLLATAETPKGRISYAKRGSANKNRMIGIQHFKDSKLRMIAYSPEAKKGYYLYSVGDKVVCTGKNDNPPEQFIKESISDIPYRLKSKGNHYFCPNISPNGDNSYFTLNWKSAGKKFSLDTRCANKDENLFMDLTSRMISKDNSKSFSLSAEYRMKCMVDCDKCRFDEKIGMKSDLKDSYLSGKLSDSELISKFERQAWQKVKSRSNIYAIDGRCYGMNMAAFLSDLRYEDWEEPAVRKVIEDSDGLVLEDGTVNEFFSESWEKNGLHAIEAIIDDEEMARELYAKYDIEDIRPREILRTALNEKERRDKLSSLPEFKNLPPKGKMADELAKMYKIQGKEKAVQHLDNMKLSDTRMKSLAYGFLKALDRGESNKWKYSESEVESGEFMEEYVTQLLNATGDEYAQALQNLLKISGSTESIEIE